MEEPLPICSACGDMIGVYEPCWLRRPDGTTVRTSLLREGGSFPAGAVPLHLGCEVVAPSSAHAAA